MVNPSGESPLVVMVAGVARAGTTMLDLMLGNGPDRFSVGEVAFRFRPRRPHNVRWRCACGRQPCEVWQRIGKVSARSVHQRVADGMGVRAVSDSSKNLAWLLDSHRWAARHGMPIATVATWKDPVELAHSYWKRTRSLTAWRRAFLSYYGRFLALRVPHISVRYRDLVCDPEVTLQRVSAYLGLPYLPGQERFWEGDHHHLFGSGGPARQASEGSGLLELEQPDEQFVRAWASCPDPSYDREVTALIEQLAANSGELGSNDPGSGRIRRPRWYYKDRLLGVARATRLRVPAGMSRSPTISE